MVEIIFAVILGLAFGSFATALVWRVPRNISWMAEKDGAARSRCPSCAAQLRFFDLIPIFSWLWQRGQCRYCNTSISSRYPLIEIGVFLACLGVYAAWGLTGQAILIMFCVPFLAALFVIDMDHMILPDQLTLACAGLGAGFIVLLSFEAGGKAVCMNHSLGEVGCFALFAWAIGAGLNLGLQRVALVFGGG